MQIKAPTSVVVSYTEMVKRYQCKGEQELKVKDNVNRYPNHRSPILGEDLENFRRSLKIMIIV